MIGELLYETFGFTFAFNWKGAALASAVMAFPLMVRAMRLSLEAVDQRLEAAARSLGAAPWRVFATITLPLMLPGILAGAILGFARSVGEFGATITFVSNIPGETRTLPLALYTLTQIPGSDAAAWRLAVLSVALALAALVASEMLARRMDHRLRGARLIDIAIEKRLGSFALDIRLEAPDSGVTALFGRSGVGKTSVINALAGLLRPDRGRIVVAGETLVRCRARHRSAAGEAAHRLCVPGRPAVSALFGARQSALRRARRRRCRPEFRHGGGTARHQGSARAAPGRSLRRREAARRHRPRAAGFARGCC